MTSSTRAEKARDGGLRFHAFRQANEAEMDGEGVPMASRQNRLGRSEARTTEDRTTMKYTHLVSEGGRRLGEIV